MKKLFTLIALCFCVNAFAVNYFPSTVSVPYGGVAQVVCNNTPNTATTVTYGVCGTTTPTGTLNVTPEWYLNGTLVYTGAPFTATTGGGSITLLAGSFSYTTPGVFTGANGLYCKLNWTPASPGACGNLVTVSSTPVAITVHASPGVITGPSTVCVGSTVIRANPATGGTWSSSASSVATVAPNTGVVSGVTPGPVTITYGNGCGPNAQTTMVVIAPPAPIGGPSFVCVGGTITLSESTLSGTWFSSNAAVASVYPFNSTVYGMSQGSATITYSTGCGADAIHAVTSRLSPAGITGSSAVCVGSSTALANTVLFGTWTSSNSSVATVVNTTGVATGANVGTTNMIYSTGCGIDAVLSFSVVVTPVTPPAIIGSHDVCIGNVTPLSNMMGGGSWTSNNITIAFVNSIGGVTGAALGTTNITYSIVNACGTAFVTHSVTVNNLAAPAPISGPVSVCGGAAILLTNAVPGGVWSSGTTLVATIDTNGIVTGASTGTTTITYTITNACSTAFTTYAVSVLGTIPSTPSAIVGAANMCAGSSRVLSSATPGGVWSSTNLGAATISNLGVLNAVGAGTTIISYSFINSCGAAAKTATVTVSTYPLPGALLGPGTVCLADTIQLITTPGGGVWSSSDPSVATVMTNGKVIGKDLGAATITYTLGNTCGVESVTTSVAVVAFGACATSVGQAAGADDLKVYPNPNTGTFTVSGLLAGADGAVSVEVANMLGQVVYKGAAATQSGLLHHHVVAANLADGVYLVTIRSGGVARSLRMTVAQH